MNEGYIHRLNPSQRSHRTIERLKFHHQISNLLDVSMVLFNDIVQILLCLGQVSSAIIFSFFSVPIATG
jgi:hypothetical protein